MRVRLCKEYLSTILAALFLMSPMEALCFASDLSPEIPDEQVDQVGFKGDVATGIAYIAATFRLPVVAECICDVLNATIPKGPLAARDAFDKLLSQTTLRWEVRSGVVYISDVSLLRIEHNYLNYRFAWFEIPQTADQFRSDLMDRLEVEHNLDPHRSGVIAKARSDIGSGELNDAQCIPEDLYQVTARDLLMKEAPIARFVTIVRYPPGNDNRNDDDAAWRYVAQN